MDPDLAEMNKVAKEYLATLEDPRKTLGFREDRGGRPTMEDRTIIENIGNGIMLYAVLDGHGGEECATYMKNRLVEIFKEKADNLFDVETIKNIFLEVDRHWCTQVLRKSGTTFTGAFISPTQVMTVNLGDSRTVLFSEDGTFVSTIDHKGTNAKEHESCEQRGGQLIPYGFVSYVKCPSATKGSLAITRALGDYEYKHNVKFDEDGKYVDETGYLGTSAVISPVPDVQIHDKSKFAYVVAGSDGIFDFVANEDIADMLKTEKYAQRLADKILMDAMFSRDNKAVIVAKL